MKWLIFISPLLIALGGCDSKVTDKIDPTLKKQLIERKLSCDKDQCPCDTPIGSVAHGSKVTTYSQSSVACNEGCGKYAEEFVCDNGNFEKDLTGRFFKCDVKECPSCTLGNNLILSGETIETYNTNEVGCHDSCEDVKQQRTCQLGLLSGSDEYRFFSCKRKTCRCRLPDNSGHISFEGTVKLYRAEKAACRTTCEDNYSLIRECESQMADDDTEIFFLSGDDSYRYRNCEEATNCFCTLPGTLGVLAHNNTRKIWDTETVACGNSCDSSPVLSVEVRCDNGIFRNVADSTEVIDFSLPAYSAYQHVCSAEECVSCRVRDVDPSGPDIAKPHGQGHIFYLTDSVGCADNCQSENRVCNDGTFGGDTSYAKASCAQRYCKCDDPVVPGVYIPVGNNRDFFTADSAECGQECADISVAKTCVERENPPGNYYYEFSDIADLFSTCSPATGCSCTLPGSLGPLADGETMVVTPLSTVPCDTACDTLSSVSVICDNGIFRNTSNSQIIDFSSGQYSTFVYECTERDCELCDVPGGTRIPHNETYTFYRTDSPECGNNCEILEKTCNDGTFTPENNDFLAAECAERLCKCEVPGIPGIYVRVEDNRNFYSSESAVCGQECSEISTAKTCTEVQDPPGVYRYEFQDVPGYDFASCNPPTGCSCALPNGLGSILDTKSVILKSQSSVPCGTSCEEVPSLDVTCDNGILVRTSDKSIVDTLDPGFAYIYFCQQDVCTDCELPGYGTIPNNEGLTLYSKDVMECSDNPDLYTFEFNCDNGALLRNGNPYDPATDPDPPATWHTSYSLSCPVCPLPWGSSVVEGTTINAYKYFGTVINDCGRGCKVTQRKCENGVLGGDPSYDMQACDNSCNMEGGGAPPRACLLRWQNSFVTPDAQIPVYKKKVVGCNDSCQDHFKLSRCQMETGTFDVSFDYIYPSCTEVCP